MSLKVSRVREITIYLCTDRSSRSQPAVMIYCAGSVWYRSNPGSMPYSCRSCRLHGSHSATWATSCRSGLSIFPKIYNVDREVRMICLIWESYLSDLSECERFAYLFVIGGHRRSGRRSRRNWMPRMRRTKNRYHTICSSSTRYAFLGMRLRHHLPLQARSRLAGSKGKII